MSWGESPLRSTSSLRPTSSPNDTSPTRPLGDQALVPGTGKSTPQATQPVLHQAVHCRFDNILPVAPGTAPALARSSSPRACTYRFRRIDPVRIAPKLSNNDPGTSNCGKLIRVACHFTKSHAHLPIITFINFGFSSESFV